VHCGAVVEAHGRTARDHCPRCLHGLHVDVVPGDRASDCGGLLQPVGAEQAGGGAWKIRYRCRICGAERVNQAILDGDTPDAWSEITRLAASSGP
jgi:DNA-directed RNA polymerase subunit RPC12/RpoP